jgi:RNA polymerase sigma-70 factor, ECF subfamily
MSETVRELEVLYKAHGPALLAYLHRLTGRRDSAEDLLHETFAQALRGMDRVSEAASPRAWLFAIARNLGISGLRRRRIATSIPPNAPAREPEVEDPRLDGMRLAIGKLPEKLREVLEFRLRDELSYEEIAAVLDIPIGTVRSRLHHAVQQLRKALKNSEV